MALKFVKVHECKEVRRVLMRDMIEKLAFRFLVHVWKKEQSQNPCCYNYTESDHRFWFSIRTFHGSCQNRRAVNGGGCELRAQSFPSASRWFYECIRKAKKPQLAQAIIEHARDGILDFVQATEINVLDRGSLLHRLLWTKEKLWRNSTVVYQLHRPGNMVQVNLESSVNVMPRERSLTNI